MIEAFLRLPFHELERLLSAAESGRLATPVTETALRTEGLAAAVPFLSVIGVFGTSEALVTFLRSVVLQRRALLEVPRPEVVWTGPEPTHSRARRTAVVVRELLESARDQVFIAGYAFDGGEELLEPLRTVMRDHDVQTRIVLDCSRHKVYQETAPQEILNAVVDEFWKEVWVDDHPRPQLFYDPRTLTRKPPWHGGEWFPEYSMHAKCIVVDRERVLVGSANFTSRAQTHNIEIGVALRDRTFALGLLHQWNAALAQNLVREVSQVEFQL